MGVERRHDNPSETLRPAITSSGHGDDRTPAALTIARALDKRLHATLEDPLHLREARLYGCTVIDGDVLSLDDDQLDAAVRFTFLGDARLVYELIGGSLGIVARAFDAAIVVTSGWGAPIDDFDDHSITPSQHPDRFRILITTVVCDDGVCSVMRNSTEPDVVIELPERGMGMLPDALELMWFGEIRDPAA
jgi:hypothetical protein